MGYLYSILRYCVVYGYVKDTVLIIFKETGRQELEDQKFVPIVSCFFKDILLDFSC